MYFRALGQMGTVLFRRTKCPAQTIQSHYGPSQDRNSQSIRCPSFLFLQFLKDTQQPAQTLMEVPHFWEFLSQSLFNFFSCNLVYCSETYLPIALISFTFLHDTGLSQTAWTGSLLDVPDWKVMSKNPPNTLQLLTMDSSQSRANGGKK